MQRTIAWASLLCAAIASAPAFAQVDVERWGLRGTQPLARPDYLEPESSVATPQAPSPGAGSENLSQGQRFKINKIDVEVEGGSAKIHQLTVEKDGVRRGVSAQDAINEITAPYLEKGKTGLATEDIVQLRDALTLLYVNSGYINSGAVIHDQDLSSGTLKIAIVEGRLGNISVQSARKPPLFHLRPSYVESRMAMPGDTPLKKEVLQAKFRALVSDPNIKRADARLIPSDKVGVADLAIALTEAPPYGLSLSAANDRSPAVGANRIYADGLLRNVTGLGDLWTLEVGATEGLVDGRMTFSIPVTSDDLAVHLALEGADAKVIETPLNALDIISQSWSVTGGVSYPVVNWFGTASSVRGTATAEVSYEWSKSDLAGLPFSFSPGAVNGKTEITLARFSTDWVFQGTTQALAVRGAASVGLDSLRPPVLTPDTPPENFATFMLQANYAMRVPKLGHQITIRLDSQWSPDSQFASEKFAFGGLDSVRGYRMNEVLADSGLAASIEYGVPLGSMSFIPETGLAAVLRDLTVSAFVDGGYGENANGPALAVNELYSVGVDLLWTPTDRINVDLSWGAQLTDIPRHPDEDPQDWGLGFRVSARLQ